jgi:hypothetical protein
MKLTGLSSLFKQMKQDGELRSKIEYRHGRVTFDVLFLIDESPFSLMFGAKGHNVSFEFKVGPGFTVTPTIPNEVYRALCKALGLTFDPTNPFRISTFLEDFSTAVPSLLGTKSKAKPQDVARHRRHVEDSDKIYFCGWRDNTKRSEHVTPKNLQKTRELLGEAAYSSCKARNISTCWTDHEDDEVEVKLELGQATKN